MTIGSFPHHAIREAGIDAAFEDVKEYFQAIFSGGTERMGLMRREQWIARPGMAGRKLAERYRLAVFTGASASGRPR